MKLEPLLQYLDDYLDTRTHPDYPGALNGLQVGCGDEEVERIAAAVDASEETIAAAVREGVGLLLVHHGLFWNGPEPVTGRQFRRVAPLIGAGAALYSCHLPLDAHPEVGNCILLARRLGLEPDGRFGEYEGAPIGWQGPLAVSRDDLAGRLKEAVQGPVHVLPGGPDEIRRVAVVTGGGASFIQEAVAAGVDAFVTGEGPHHSYVDAMELGINVFYGGHYATETFGVRALAARLEARFDLAWTFLDFPSGL